VSLRLAPVSQVFRNLDFGGFELVLDLLEFFPQLLAVMECLVSLAEQVIVREHLVQPISFQLALDHVDQGIAGHGVELDALVEQDVDLGITRAILGELTA